MGLGPPVLGQRAVGKKGFCPRGFCPVVVTVSSSLENKYNCNNVDIYIQTRVQCRPVKKDNVLAICNDL